MKLEIKEWKNGAPIPAKYAFGKPGADSPFAPSENISPALFWNELPEGTKSLALICHDPDVPSKPDDVNQEGRVVPADLPRVPFYHWVLVNIPAELDSIPEGAGSNGLTPRGKEVGETEFGVTGKNDYTAWFAGDAEMEGVYGGYDGPCPPWNDSIVHHYHFTLYALDVPSLDLDGDFGGNDALAAIKKHVLDSASHMGVYSMNPDHPAH